MVSVRKVLGVVAAVTAVVFTVGVAPAGAASPARPRTGPACLTGSWSLDLERLVEEASVTQKLTPSGTVELKFRRGEFTQGYADTLTGESTGATGTTIKVTNEYGGAVGGSYHTTGRAQLDLSDIVNTTSMKTTVSVNGIAGEPNTQSPAPGTQTATVTLAYTCRGNTLQITTGGAVAQHYTRIH